MFVEVEIKKGVLKYKISSEMSKSEFLWEFIMTLTTLVHSIFPTLPFIGQ